MGNQITGEGGQQVFTPKDIKRLYKRFTKLDKDKSGQLEPEEFFDIPGRQTILTQLCHRTHLLRESFLSSIRIKMERSALLSS